MTIARWKHDEGARDIHDINVATIHIADAKE
jgi:hypothetical protein